MRGTKKNIAKTRHVHHKGERTWKHVSLYPPHITYLIEEALAGDADAQNELGDLYREGNGVKHDLKKALRWYQMAADQGDPVGQNNMGSMYFNGLGVPYDPEEAVKWYRLAAAQGVPTAQFNLGICYKDGEGVPPDKTEATKWLELASEGGYSPSDSTGSSAIEVPLKKSKEKPTLFLLPGKDAFDTDSVAKLYKALTGRDATPEELEEDRFACEKE